MVTWPADDLIADRAQPAEPPRRVQELRLAEQFVIWALRARCASGPAGTIVRGFRLAFGLSGVEPALACFEALYGAIRGHARRDLWLHRPCCPCAGGDELAVVAVVAACQAGRTLQAHRLAGLLVGGGGIDLVLCHAGQLAAFLRERRLVLPERPWPQPSATVHRLH
jgi:hypothetical protein